VPIASHICRKSPGTPAVTPSEAINDRKKKTKLVYNVICLAWIRPQRYIATSSFLFLLSTTVLIFKGQVFNYKIAYDRYWEGRKLWGSLLIDCRSLIRQAISLTGLPFDSHEVRGCANLVTALAHTLRHQLRSSDSANEMERLLPVDLAKKGL
jgi:predicted membrane chloride channel (bestrophin family)